MRPEITVKKPRVYEDKSYMSKDLERSSSDVLSVEEED
jgi:hypothetical protein